MDIFCEYIVKVKRSPLEILISVLGVFLAAILIFLSLGLLSTAFSSFVLLIDAAIVYGVYILVTHFDVEYEYIFTNGDLDIDKIIAKRKRKRMFSLSVKEFELLLYFVENQKIALSREKILNHVWDYDYFGDARTIDTHVKKLRNKLGEKGNYIKTIWGMGYKFEV